MAILAAVRAKKPEMGYATDFVDVAMRQVLPSARPVLDKSVVRVLRGSLLYGGA